MIEAQILENHKIMISKNAVSDSVKYETVRFTFPKFWDNYAKTAVFKNGARAVSVVLDKSNPLCVAENECYIPHEVLSFPGFSVSVFGNKDESRATTENGFVAVIRSGYEKGVTPEDPTPDEYSQIIALMTKTKEIAQSIKDNSNNGTLVGGNNSTQYFGIEENGTVYLKPEYRGGALNFAADYKVLEKLDRNAIADDLDTFDESGVRQHEWRLKMSKYSKSDKDYETDQNAENYGYCAEGSKINELPEILIIPSSVNGIEVTSLAPAMFAYNKRVKQIVLPDSVQSIPFECFSYAINLEKVSNTRNITSIGYAAFLATRIQEIEFNALTDFYLSGNGNSKAFAKSAHLIKINIGNATSIPVRCFSDCTYLERIRHNSSIIKVDNSAFYNTPSLKNIDFATTLTNIGPYAFKSSGVIFDWSTLKICEFGTEATPLQMNKGITSDNYTASVKPGRLDAPAVLFEQSNPKWAKDKLNNVPVLDEEDIPSGEDNYMPIEKGCLFYSVMGAYCGIRGLKCDNPYDLININKTIPATAAEIKTPKEMTEHIRTEHWDSSLPTHTDYIYFDREENTIQHLSGGDHETEQTLKELCPNLEAGDTITLSYSTADSLAVCIYGNTFVSSGTAGNYHYYTCKLTEQGLNNPIYIEGFTGTVSNLSITTKRKYVHYDTNGDYVDNYFKLVKYTGNTVDDVYIKDHHYLLKGNSETIELTDSQTGEKTKITNYFYEWHDLKKETLTNLDLFVPNQHSKTFKKWVEGLGLTVTENDFIDPSKYSTIIEALQNGSYVVLNIPGSVSKGAGHAILLYGVNANQEVLYVNTSAPGLLAIEDYSGVVGSSLLQNISVATIKKSEKEPPIAKMGGIYTIISEGTTKSLLNETVDGKIAEALEDIGGVGENGKDGVSATHSWNGTTLTITSASGTSSADLKGDKGDKGDTGDKGDKGDKGEQGEKGEKGEDADETAIKQYVDQTVENQMQDVYSILDEVMQNMNLNLTKTYHDVIIPSQFEQTITRSMDFEPKLIIFANYDPVPASLYSAMNGKVGTGQPQLNALVSANWVKGGFTGLTTDFRLCCFARLVYNSSGNVQTANNVTNVEAVTASFDSATGKWSVTVGVAETTSNYNYYTIVGNGTAKYHLFVIG